MAALDDILAERSRNEDAHLAQAAHDATWTNTFASAPSADRLRNNLNLTEMVNGAMDMKLALAARTDKNAQEIYQKGEKFKEWQDQTPLRDQYLRAQIEAQGAATKYKMQQDVQSLEETSNFYRGLAKIPHPLGSPEHAAAVTELAAAHPLALSTVAVRDDLKAHSQVHDSAALLHKSIADFKTETGVAPLSFETTATGGVNLKGKAEDVTKASSDIVSEYAKTQAALEEHRAAAKTQEASDIKAKTFDVPYQGAGKLHAAEKLAAILEAKYPELKALNPSGVAEGGVAPKTLDADTAKSLLKEAGNDKDKARALAKERGYSF